MIHAVWYCIGAFILAVYIYGLRPIARWKARNFPGPSSAWLIGNKDAALNFMQHDIYQQWGHQFGQAPIAVQLAADTLIVVGNPEDARTMLQHNSARPIQFSQDGILPRTPDNDPALMILFSRGEQWKSLRAAWQPMFFRGSLSGYCEIMDESAKLLVNSIRKSCASEGKYFEAEHLLLSMTFDIIVQTAFGVKLKVQQAEAQTPADKKAAKDLMRSVQAVTETVVLSPLVVLARLFPFMAPLLSRLAFWTGDRDVLQYKTNRYGILTLVRKLLRQHSAAMKAAPADNLQTSIRSGVRPGSFIDLLVRSSNRSTGGGFSDDVHSQQILMMLVAGHETTGNTLCFTLYLLARACNSDIQAAVLNEIDALGKDFHASLENLETRLPYLDAVVKEVLRLYPTLHVLVREALHDQSVAGKQVCRGQIFTVSAYAIHHDRDIWGELVEDFMPQRWLSENPAELKQMNRNFFAFGAGPRACPGQRFAMLEIKITLIRIFQEFTIHLAPVQETQGTLPLKKNILLLAPEKGLYLEAAPRVING